MMKVLNRDKQRKCENCGYYVVLSEYSKRSRMFAQKLSCLACTPADHAVWEATGRCPLESKEEEKND